MHSTRADVERLLGPSSSDSLTGRCQCLYQLKDENVHILYANGYPCSEPEQRDGKVGDWKVPRDTVISLTVYYKKLELKFSDLNIDESKYNKETDEHLPGVFSYINSNEGVEIAVIGSKVQSITYFPAAKDNNLRCPTIAVKQPCNKAPNQP